MCMFLRARTSHTLLSLGSPFHVAGVAGRCCCRSGSTYVTRLHNVEIYSKVPKYVPASSSRNNGLDHCEYITTAFCFIYVNSFFAHISFNFFLLRHSSLFQQIDISKSCQNKLFFLCFVMESNMKLEFISGLSSYIDEITLFFDIT